MHRDAPSSPFILPPSSFILSGTATLSLVRHLLALVLLVTTAACQQHPQQPTVAKPSARHAPPAAEGPFRPGGDVTLPILRKKIDPVYPDPSHETRRSAGVHPSRRSDHAAGRMRDVKVLRGADDPLTPYILEAIPQWEFTPGMRKGQPVEVYYNFTFNIEVR